MSAVTAVAERLRTLIPSRTVYEHEAPNGPLPPRYLLVRGSLGDESSSRFGDQTDMVRESVWVTSVSRNDDPDVAAVEADWASRKGREVLRDFTPLLGRVSFPVTSVQGQPVQRDDSLPAATVYAVEQYAVQYQL